MTIRQHERCAILGRDQRADRLQRHALGLPVGGQRKRAANMQDAAERIDAKMDIILSGRGGGGQGCSARGFGQRLFAPLAEQQIDTFRVGRAIAPEVDRHVGAEHGYRARQPHAEAQRMPGKVEQPGKGQHPAILAAEGVV